MEKYVNLELPKSLSQEDADALSQELKSVEGIEEVGSGDARFIDPASIMAWITLASTVIGAIDQGIPIFAKIKEIFKRKGVHGVKISKPDGTTISIDETSAEDIVRLLHSDE